MATATTPTHAADGSPPETTKGDWASTLQAGKNVEQQMSDLVAFGQHRRAVKLFQDWKQGKLEGAPPFAPSLMSYNLYLLGAARDFAVDLPAMLEAVDSMIKDHNLVPSAMTYNALLRHCSRTSNPRAASKIMQRMKDEGLVPNATSYMNAIGAMIAGASPLMALEVLREMRGAGLLTKGVSSGVEAKHVYTDVLQLLFRKRQLPEVKEVLEYMMEDNCALQPFMCGETLAVAAEADDDALGLLVVQVIANMTGAEADSKWWGVTQGEVMAIVTTAARKGNVELAEQAFALLKWDPADEVADPPLLPTLHAMVECYVKGKRLEEAFLTMATITRAYPDSDLSATTFSAVVEAASADVGAIDKAYYTLADMHASGRPVCVAAVNAVIAGCVRLGDMDRAFETMLELQRLFMLRPTAEVYGSLMQGCSANGQPETTFLLAEEMAGMGLAPTAETYGSLIHSHIILKRHQDAFNVVLEMSDAGVIPSRESVMRLLAAYRRDNQVNLLVELKRLLLVKYGHREVRSTYNRRRIGKLISDCGKTERAALQGAAASPAS